MMNRFEKLYKLVEKYYWLLFIFFLFLPNFLEPTWFWRWLVVIVVSLVFAGVFVWGYYAWLVLKRNPLSLTTRSKTQFENLNSSQKKWHLVIFYLTMFVAGPIVFYVASFPLIDTAKAFSGNDYVKTATVTVEDRSTAMGTWFVGQSLKIREENISGRTLLLMFSFEHALEGEQYEIRYLPYSGLILELKAIR